MNCLLAQSILKNLAEKGVKTFCLCPGGRAAPFVEALCEAKNIELLSFYDEQSASFFALGRAKRDNRPVAVVTTSGTAVAQLLPACIEAYYSNQPLVFITSDRPLAQCQKGSPQTLEQASEILKPYVGESQNISSLEDLKKNNWSFKQAGLHLNVSFDTPLIDKKITSFSLNIKPSPLRQDVACLSEQDKKNLKTFITKYKKPLLLIGELQPEELTPVKTFLTQAGVPFYAEPLSQLESLDNQLLAGENILNYIIKTKAVDAVIRLGGIPRTSFFRKMETYPLPVMNLVHPPSYPGLSRKSLTLALLPSLKELTNFKLETPNHILEADKDLLLRWKAILKNYPNSEAGWFKTLKETLPQNSSVFLGNSLPIRTWDLMSFIKTQVSCIRAQSGVNGIDGLVSHFLGSCQSSQNNVGILGDLSTLYDMSGFWIAEKVPNFHLILINNGGGQIFSQMYDRREFINAHSLQFCHLAQLWSLPYNSYKDSKNYKSPRPNSKNFTEVRPDPRQSQECFRMYHASLLDFI